MTGCRLVIEAEKNGCVTFRCPQSGRDVIDGKIVTPSITENKVDCEIPGQVEVCAKLPARERREQFWKRHHPTQEQVGIYSQKINEELMHNSSRSRKGQTVLPEISLLSEATISATGNLSNNPYGIRKKSSSSR